MPIFAAAPGGVTILVGFAISLTCFAVVAAVGVIGHAVLDQKKGDTIPPKSTWRNPQPPMQQLPPPGPMPPPGPNPNLDPHQNPFNPVGRGAPTGGIVGLIAAALAALLSGHSTTETEPIKSQALQPEHPAPGPHP